MRHHPLVIPSSFLAPSAASSSNTLSPRLVCVRCLCARCLDRTQTKLRLYSRDASGFFVGPARRCRLFGRFQAFPGPLWLLLAPIHSPSHANPTLPTALLTALSSARLPATLKRRPSPTIACTRRPAITHLPRPDPPPPSERARCAATTAAFAATVSISITTFTAAI